MHTVLVILGGLVLLALTVLLARLTGRPVRSLLPAFVAVWFVCAAINMWIGIAGAGYSFLEELPIFAVIFVVPVAVALFLARKR